MSLHIPCESITIPVVNGLTVGVYQHLVYSFSLVNVAIRQLLNCTKLEGLRSQRCLSIDLVIINFLNSDFVWFLW